MFLVPPKILFLPPNSDTAQLLAFGDPTHLKGGVLLAPKENPQEKRKIYSLYDLELETKYITEQGNIVKRTAKNQIVVKKKSPSTQNSNQSTTTITPSFTQSKPINIPDSASITSTSSSFRNSYLRQRSFQRHSLGSESEDDRSVESTDSIGECHFA